MYKSFISMTAMLFFSTVLFAGWQADGGPMVVAESSGQQFTQPRWSPDGRYLAFGGTQYKGLWILEVASGDISQISDQESAGFAFHWSPDGQTIVSRVTRYENQRRLNAVMTFSVSGEEKILQNFDKSKPGLPVWNSSGTKVLIPRRKDFQTIVMTAATDKNSAQVSTAFFLQQGKMLRVDDDGRIVNRLDPFPGRRYLNVAVAPDGQRVAFEVIGGNLYVMDADGNNLTDLGVGYRPQWAPDSRHVAYIISSDDGHQFQSADIFIADSQTAKISQISDSRDLLEMSATWSADGQALAFDTDNDGKIYVQKLKFSDN